ncbi:MAG: TIGR02206 family membrane protein [Anaerolineales bacterium]|nr:TIGR02206 family membrane protein [Chloroflexota bacterium]MBL6983431.1 TIGR02206 family membrane protein [Anaerolineales bacterium]
MIQYFASDYSGAPFVLFDSAHWTALGVVALVVAALGSLGRLHTTKYGTWIRYGLATLLIINELARQAWLIYYDEWTIQWNLPLHLCSIFVWLSAYMLLTKNHAIFEFAYFLGIAGALQPLLTPDAGKYGFPHFYPVQLFISHGGIIAAVVHMAASLRWRPYWSSIKKVIIWGNVYLVFITVVNLLIGSNYLYTLHKPHVMTLLDFLGPWPWYLISAEIVALGIFLILYSPYLIKDRFNLGDSGNNNDIHRLHND